MNKHLQHLLDILQQQSLTVDQKREALQSLKAADKELEITAFKLDRTEKVKHTTAVLLEETIAELEQKRKAVEIQNRELEIEAAMEKVRVRSLAMQKPEELAEVAEVLRKEMGALGVEELETSSIYIVDDTTGTSECWYAIKDVRGKNKKLVTDHITLRLDETWVGRQMKKFHGSKETRTSIVMRGENRKEWINHCAEKSSVLRGYYGSEIPERTYHLLKFSNGFMGAASPGEISAESWDLLQRATAVFSFAYKRFSDLQKAEAQVREAQIETALEKVRSRSMGMQKSEELKDVIKVVYDQFVHLNINIEHAGFIIDYKTRDDMHIWLADRHEVPFQVNIPYFDCAHWNSFNEAKEKGLDFFANHLSFEEKNRFYQDLFKLIPGVPEETLQYYFSCHGLAISTVLLENIGLYIENFSGIPFSDEENNTLMRFGKVFQQTHTRFLDLQKAEAQAKEALIEAALERVRSRTMAMQRSEELPEVAALLFQQVKTLGVPQFHCGFNIFEIDDKECTWYPGSADGDILPPCKIPLTEHPVFMAFNESRKRGDELFVYEKEGEYQAGHYRYMLSLPVLGEILQNMLDAGIPFPTFQIDHLANFSHGNLLFITSEHFPEMHDTFKRFAKVFEQTYTRFLDLQKAEGQAREAQIEAALERVRSKTMAMHHSEELKEVVLATFEQLKSLSILIDTCSINLFTEGSNDWNIWVASSEQKYPLNVRVPYFKHAIFDQVAQARNMLGSAITFKLSKEENQIFYKHVLQNSDIGKLMNEGRKSLVMNADSNIFSLICFKYTSLSVANFRGLLYTEEENTTILRFAKVFEQTYTRFLDLQKAEAQAREAQIEASLERVRAKTMAMHNSADVGESITALFDELVKLGVTTNRCGILIHSDSEFSEVWTAKSTPNEKATLVIGKLEITMHPMLVGQRTSWLNKEPFFSYELTGQDMINYYQAINNSKYYPTQFNLEALPAKEIHSDFHFSDGSLFAFTNEALPAESAAIFKRFTSVFGQTYCRYLDLQKAEAQAREAQIEAALERVRANAMAMQRSSDLLDIVVTMRHEFTKLGHEAHYFWYMNWLADKYEKAMTSGDGTRIGMVLELPRGFHGNAAMNEWELNDEPIGIFTFEPEAAIDYLNRMASFGQFRQVDPNAPGADAVRSIGGLTFVMARTRQGEIGYSLPGVVPMPPPEDMKTLVRFAGVFDLAYQRYSDIAKAESSAKAALQQSSLDRVRAEIASMRTKQDLERITPLIWKELTTLGIPFVRCGVFIMDEQEELIHTFLSTPDGKAIAALHLPYQSSPLAGAIEFWREKKRYLTHWGIKEYADFADSFIDKSETEKRTHFLSSVPKEGIHLHLLPFMQGMLYVGNTTSLTDDNLHLVQSVADAFSTAYARYEDFNKIESAKAQVEKTLSDLKQTQAQLVQSEKMASLGELTAGIAHEIQNPLNFVNNFSEVSTELIDEMKTELATGNLQLATEISNDLKQNLEKINHHGKRAADIVKGMLQHSRTSTGTKEPTDVNALADEYLRLAYHGLRAKDKSFNATMKTDFDETIGKVNIIPQDIGRVILNLITNAFYAVNERQKLLATSHELLANYEPTVLVSTKREGSKVLISVKDNGNGIPQKILDKIFQPFFTTKPTGQGTGLGLSLSYDIVKAHGGEIKVTTKENEGTEFIIQLPIV